MQLLREFPFQVHEQNHVLIPMSDGIHLSARIWLPENAHDVPVPAILEYIPYRKRDFTAYRDSLMHPYFAGHGYASIRVDMRGSGESEGVLTDEYLQLELTDGQEILQWIAAQPWCTGSIGMIGISWGGFNGLQIAAQKPKELKSIITVCSSDDRYSDDVH
ncbi:MAG: CocE/NonD family hydrolase, partial [Spirochaeta sp.]